MDEFKDFFFFLISKEFGVNLFICSLAIFSDKCLLSALALICLVFFFSFLLNIYIFISALVLSDKQVIFKVLFKRNTKHLARTSHAFLSALVELFRLDETKKREKVKVGTILGPFLV